MPERDNGYGHVKLRKLLQYHEDAADALRRTLALLGDDAQISASRRAETTFRAAVALDTDRRTEKEASKVRYVEKKRAGYYSAEAKLQRRRDTADFLATLSRTTPRTLTVNGTQVGIQSLVRFGYVRAAGKDHYLRTAKPYVIGGTEPAPVPRRTGMSATQRTVKALRDSARKAQMPSAAMAGSREDKRRIVLQLVRDAKRPVTSDDLREKARAKGVQNLIGMDNYARDGYLRKKTTASGVTLWSFVKMPGEERKKKSYKGSSSVAALAARHARVGKFLAFFNTETPSRPPFRIEPHHGLSSLIKTGHLKKVGDEGWVRTEKPF